MRKKNALLAVGLSLFVLLMLAATNPRPDQFSVWLEIQGIKEGANTEADGLATQDGAFGTIASAGVLPSVDSSFSRADCFVFSLYSSRRANGRADRSYLGIARNFLRLH